MELRDYQHVAAQDALAFLQSGGEHRCYAAPTGSGKSVIELAVLQALPRALLVTPRLDIVAGMLQKRGIPTSQMSERVLADAGLEQRITTPVRLRNRLRDGRLDWQPEQLLLDEVHHANALTYQELRLLTRCPLLGWTASPYRGTPRSTAEFLAFWGEPVQILTVAEAAERGVLSFPSFRVCPLVDDDRISVSSTGDFVISSAAEAVQSRLEAVVELCRPLFDGRRWDRPTMLALPSVETASGCRRAFEGAGIRTSLVTGDTPQIERQRAFAAAVARERALIQIGVVSEGVDLPLRRLIDLLPTLSPVRWIQLLGRITRPVAAGEAAPEYWGCCRNLERHAYLLEGLVPLATLAQAQTAFGKPSSRAGVRVLGLEKLGRFKAVDLPLLGGVKGQMYCVQQVEQYQVRQWAILVHPAGSDPIVATRINGRAEDGSRYGRWQQQDRLPEIRDGFASVPAGSLSPKQERWWFSEAARYGLDPGAPVNRRSFAALPVLADLGLRLESL
ncbi:MAG: DEAD/DEAH box helicase [Gemmataceae bacterium]